MKRSHLLTLLHAPAAPGGGGPALPGVESATLLLNLQADALSLSDGDPVGTWSNVGTLGGSFTQTGSARPTWRAGGGVPYVEFDGTDDNMAAGAAINTGLDSLSSMTIFIVGSYTAGDGMPLSKFATGQTGTEPGWFVGAIPVSEIFIFASGGDPSEGAYINSPIPSADTVYLATLEMVSNASMTVYVNGSAPVDQSFDGSGTVTNYSTSEPVRLGATGDVLDGYAEMHIHAAMIYAPAPNATDRDAITAWLADKYGITL